MGNEIKKEEILERKVYTPTGYKLLKDIKVGDIILDGNGKATKVKKISSINEKECYKIWFNDRTYITVDEEHLINFYQQKIVENHRESGMNKRIITMGKVQQVLNVSELKKYLEKEQKYYKFAPLRLKTPIPEFKKQKVEINSYVLGLLLGDGCISATSRYIGFTNLEKDVVGKLKKYCKIVTLQYDKTRAKEKQCNWHIYDSALMKKLKEYNLWGTNSSTKFIPKEYLYNDYETRLALVQGLMDTDGTVVVREHRKKNGKVYKSCYYEYCTVSPQLSKDFDFLVRSLGCVDTVVKSASGYRKNGEYRKCQDRYRHFIRIPNGLEIVWCKRKKKNIIKKQLNEPVRSIIKIEKDEKKKTKKIYVESETKMYLTDNFLQVVTER